jgi:hypothetical protein
MKVVPVAGGHEALVDDEDYELVAQHRWRLAKGGYARTWMPMIRGRRASVSMHRLLVPAQVVDHVNGNGLDNRRGNLRPATPAENARNRRKLCAATSQYRGVSWNERRGAWKSSVYHAGRRYFLGYFTNELDAAEAYQEKAKELFGEFA